MVYQISRGGQTYGPYTLADLKRYVDSGHVLLSDMAKGDEMPEWVTVSQILNPSRIPPIQPPEPVVDPAYPSAYPQQQTYVPLAQFPDPPNLHWGLVLLFDLLTAKLFQMVWNLIFASWMKRVQQNSKALIYYAAGYILGFFYTFLYLPSVLEQVRHIMAGDTGFHPHQAHAGLMYLAGFAAWIFKLLARFDMKRSLEEHFNSVEPIGFRMSGVLTFFFGGLYIQSQLNRINEIKQAIRYQQSGR